MLSPGRTAWALGSQESRVPAGCFCFPSKVYRTHGKQHLSQPLMLQHRAVSQGPNAWEAIS